MTDNINKLSSNLDVSKQQQQQQPTAASLANLTDDGENDKSFCIVTLIRKNARDEDLRTMNQISVLGKSIVTRDASLAPSLSLAQPTRCYCWQRAFE